MKEKIKNWHNIPLILTILFVIVAILLLVLDFSGKINLPSILRWGFVLAVFYAIVVPFGKWLSK